MSSLFTDIEPYGYRRSYADAERRGRAIPIGAHVAGRGFDTPGLVLDNSGGRVLVEHPTAGSVYWPWGEAGHELRIAPLNDEVVSGER